jgi:large conductance mechanosensitive channel
MIKEFKKFISKGNVIELAVGLIIALYFGAIIKSLVDHIIMPPIGMLLGNVDFSELKIVLQDAVIQGDTVVVPEVAISIGLFLNTIITFLIVAFAVFLIILPYNKFRTRVEKKEEPAAAAPIFTNEELLLGEIRDLLKKQATPPTTR